MSLMSQMAAQAIGVLARNQKSRAFDPNSPIVKDQTSDEKMPLDERVKPRIKTISGANAVVFQWGPGGFSDETNIAGSTGKTSARWGVTAWWG